MQIIKASMQQAKDALKHKWHKAILVFCIVAAVLGTKSLLVSLVSFIFSQGMSSLYATVFTTVLGLAAVSVELFGFCPFYVGVARWLWQVVLGADEPFDTVFYSYETKSDYKKAIEISFNFIWRICGYFLLSGVPFIATTMAKNLVLSSAYFGTVIKTIVFFVWILFAVLGAVLFIILISRHFLVLPVIFSDDKLDIYDAFKLSSIIAKGKISSFMYMVLRFIPLLLLCALAIPMIWVLPYFATSILSYSKSVIDEFKSAYSRTENQP